MKRPISRRGCAPAAGSVLLLIAACALHADTTYTFQNGLNGYTGAQDVSINTQYAQYNGGNGILWRGDAELGCYTTTGTGAYSVRYLLKFGGLSIPVGSTVVSASLSMSFDYWNSGGNTSGFYVKNSWNGASSRIGWLHRDDTNDWAAGGASSAGVDTVAGKGFQVPSLRAVGVQTVTIPLDAGVVQSWINSPSANQGIMLVNNLTGDILRPVSTAGTQNIRPKLTVVIATAAGVQVTVTPPNATLAPGGTQVFTATVTGASNTAVTWTATGGTITTAGVFTAGTAAGNFAVTATSIADKTKSASAAVSIQQAAVGVTVSPTSATLSPGGTQQFTAAVTGTSNTAVNWAATGGAISTSGLFTAGTTAGTNFTVTATSAADTTKSATAHVTIQAPVGITVSPTSATLSPGNTQQFTATVTGTSNTAVTWTATGGAISTSGLYTAGQTTGSFSVTATSAADTTKGASASVGIANSTGLPPIPRQADGPYVVIQSPATGMHFTAPATIRIYADPYDGNAPDPDALTVTFLVNGQSVGTYTGNGAQNGYFALIVNNLAAGTYAITGRITPTGGGTPVTSAPVTVFVDNPPASTGPVFNLTADVVLSGSQVGSYVGTAGNPCTINGNGFQIRAASGFTGSLNIVNCNVFGLGTATKPGVDVTTNGSGSIQLTGNVFEMFGTISIGANDQAQAVVRNNEFRENTLVPVGSQPADTSTETLPVFHATGNSSAQQYFQGNNVGLSIVTFDSTRNWLIGGNSDAESNVLMGVRCGFAITNSSGMVLRGNCSQHNYPHRFSQGENFQLDGDGFLVEHNVIRSSSWPVRGMGGELRYNLIDASGNTDQVLEAPMSNANIHHNIFSFTVSQTFYSPSAGLSLLYNVDNVQFHHNDMDGGGTFMQFSGSPVLVTSGSFIGSLRNNVFYNFALPGGPPLSGDISESTNPPLARLRYADYNDFYNPAASTQVNYGLGVVGLSPGSAGYGMHDLGGFNGHVNPKFTQPTVLPFPFRPEDIWSRTKKVSDVLATYRAMYTPASGSPLIGAGDPQDGAGGNIGAIGNGEPADQFGRFGGGTPPPPLPVIASFTATPGSVQAGQSATLSWSVTGATSLTVSPAPGTVTGSSVSVTPAATTTYILTATNAGGSVTATTSVTVAASTISVIVSPSGISLAAGGTQQFTATVSGTSNTSVNWTATGGTITTGGLFTAGQTAGSFQVTAMSPQDATKSGSAVVTITSGPPQVSVTVSPSSVMLFPAGTQQFTAIVSGASNTAVTWTATGGSITAGGLFTAGQTTGSFQVTATSAQDSTKSGAGAVTIVTQSTSGGHPRIILDAPTLTTLRNRAAANTPQWKALKSVCDSLVGGTVLFPGGNGYPDLPDVGEGYQGSSYLDALMPLGLCYHTLRSTNPTAAAPYGAKGVAILAAMSDPGHQVIDGTPIQDRDDGYGIRFYGFVMGVGYDWFHDLLSPALETQVQNALNTWIHGFENDDPDAFEYEHPMGNYFAGYYAAKCMAALAVQGDSPLGDTWWNDWYNNQHNQRVAPYFTLNLAGGGWPEGFANYGPLATRNQALPVLAVRSAKGLDLIHAPQPYTFPLDQARWVMHFTWPSRDMVDDRDTVHSNDSDTIWPGTPDANTYSFLAGYLAMWNDPLAPAMHKYARDAKAALAAEGVDAPDAWVEFLFWDDAAPEADYSTGSLSYLAPGTGEVAARSDWSNAATWMSFRSGPYVNNPGAGHQGFDAGSVALVRDKSPLVVNVEGWLAHNPNGDPGENAIYDDNFGNWDVDHTLGNRRLYNTFQVRHVDTSGNILDNFGEWALQRTDGVHTQVSRFEDGGSYVMAVGQFLEDMYRPFQTICNAKPVTSWSREVVYLRPSRFVVYDRTTICNSSLDQYMAFHFPGLPTEVTAPAAGLHRFDVTAGSTFAGTMTTLLPANAQFAITDHDAPDPATWSKVWRSEIRPTGAAAASRLWMTVFDLSPTASQVAAATPVTVVSGSVVGAVLASAAGNSVTVFGTAAVGAPVTGTISYSVPAAQTRHVISDLTPSGTYSVTVTVSGGGHTVTVTSGGSLHASANGVLSFGVTAAGVLQP